MHVLRQVVFLDECGSNISLTPLYAQAPKGERARGSAPHNRGKNTTLIAALTLEGMGASMILEGSANTTAFELYIEQILVPSLHAGQIVIMDNLQAHKSARVRAAIEAKGCQLLFLQHLLVDDRGECHFFTGSTTTMKDARVPLQSEVHLVADP